MEAVHIIKLSIAKDFSMTPGPRYEDEGNWSGERFRKDILLPKLKEAIDCGGKIIINFDGTAGYGTSFLEEAFGGLIRVDNLSYSDIYEVIKLESIEEEYLKEDIDNYMRDAENEKQTG